MSFAGALSGIGEGLRAHTQRAEDQERERRKAIAEMWQALAIMPGQDPKLVEMYLANKMEATALPLNVNMRPEISTIDKFRESPRFQEYTNRQVIPEAPEGTGLIDPTTEAPLSSSDLGLPGVIPTPPMMVDPQISATAQNNAQLVQRAMVPSRENIAGQELRAQRAIEEMKQEIITSAQTERLRAAGEQGVTLYGVPVSSLDKPPVRPALIPPNTVFAPYNPETEQFEPSIRTPPTPVRPSPPSALQDSALRAKAAELGKTVDQLTREEHFEAMQGVRESPGTFLMAEMHRLGIENLRLKLDEAERDAQATLTPQQFQQRQQVSGEYLAQSQDFLDRQDMFITIREAAKDPNAINDIGLVFGFMKMLDPTSVVRESEQQLVISARGVPDTIKNSYRSLWEGRKLTDIQIQQIVSLASSRYKSSVSVQKQRFRRYNAILSKQGITTGVPDLTDLPVGVGGTQETTWTSPSGKTYSGTPEQIEEFKRRLNVPPG